MRYGLALVCLLLLPSLSPAQTAPPLFETRAVWFATVLGDGGWPASTIDTPDRQAEDLRDRIADAGSRGMNTFVFQAVARGDAMYPSERLPWSARLRGPGLDPGYDPLAVAIEEAHARGMELHVWINVFRVGDTTTEGLFAGVTDPPHVLTAHPEWVQTVDGNPWIDPSSPEARAWLVDNVLEIVEHYDLDAVHFDFIRYPSGGLPNDGVNFQFDDRGFEDIDDWRRDNVTQFVRDVYARILDAKPWVKVGSAPIGNYENFPGAWPALWAFSDVFQESRRWLAEGIHDYLAPQLYFTLGRTPEPGNSFDSPDFAFLARDWVDHAGGRPVFTGIGAFKDNVRPEILAQIDTSRAAGAQGQVYFRFDDLLALDFGDRYEHPALPAPMTHRFEAAAPSPPVLAEIGPSFRLDWAPSTGAATDPVRAYVVFSRSGEPPELRPEDLIDVVDAATTSWSGIIYDTSPQPPDYYRVAAVSRLGILSEPSEAVNTSALVVSAEDETTPGPIRLERPYPNPASSFVNVAFVMDRAAPVRWTVTDLLGRRVLAREAGFLSAGAHRDRLDLGGLASGVYLLTLEADGRRVSRRVVIAR